MKYWIIAGCFLLTGWTRAQACDACGCGMNFGGPGLLMQQQAHFLGWVTTYQAFVYPESETYDYFLQSELWARWAFSQRWATTIRLPYHLHHRSSAGADPIAMQGIGDLRAQIRYLAISTNDTSKATHQVFFQSEWRLPTSTLVRPLDSQLPGRFFPGQSQWVHRMGLLHAIQFSAVWSLTSELAYAYTQGGDLRYRLGQQSSLLSMLARHWNGSKERFSAWAGALWLSQKRDVENGFYRNDTGGHGVSGLAGAQWEGRRWNVGLQAQIPIWQQFGGDALRTLPSAQLICQFRL